MTVRDNDSQSDSVGDFGMLTGQRWALHIWLIFEKITPTEAKSLK